jgi:hypothetical protein
MTRSATPVTAQFYRLIPGIPEPRRADRSADGTMPMRAYRYCEAMTTASAFGWYFYPPINFRLWMEGNEVFWTYEGADGSYPLGAAQFPGFRQFFENNAPTAVKEWAPLFLGTSRTAGVVQIWSGYFARTAPRWALLSRGPANIPVTKPYENFEGMMETDRWFGPLMTNIRLTRSDSPVDFHVSEPLFQVQPVLRRCYRDPSFEVREFEDLGEGDWSRFARTMKRAADNRRRPGHYAAETRKRLHADAAD